MAVGALAFAAPVYAAYIYPEDTTKMIRKT